MKIYRRAWVNIAFVFFVAFAWEGITFYNLPRMLLSDGNSGPDISGPIDLEPYMAIADYKAGDKWVQKLLPIKMTEPKTKVCIYVLFIRHMSIKKRNKRNIHVILFSWTCVRFLFAAPLHFKMPPLELFFCYGNPSRDAGGGGLTSKQENQRGRNGCWKSRIIFGCDKWFLIDFNLFEVLHRSFRNCILFIGTKMK